MSNLRLNKESSFNKSFERENGLLYFGQNKSITDFSVMRGNSINKNGSINMGFNPYRKEGKQPINLFVELADEANNDKNDDFLNFNLLQKNGSSVRPMMMRDKSCNSTFSLNVNTGNEFYFHNPIPIKPKFEEAGLPKPSFLRRESSIKESPRFENMPSMTSFPPQMELKKEESEPVVDCGDMWVKSQTQMYGQDQFNWNQEVEGLLESDDELQISQNEKPKKTRAAKPAQAPNVNIRRHRKKSKKQLEILDSHFDINVEWTLDLVEKLAEELNLEKDQVYKWNWDKRKRLRKRAERQGKAQAKNKRQRGN